MTVSNHFAVNMLTRETKALSDFRGTKVHAVAGVGHPERFFDSLRESELDIEAHAFPDHYRYEESDMIFNDELPVMMTEKDAVKCHAIGKDHWYFLKIDVELDQAFLPELISQLKTTPYCPSH